MAGTKTIPIVFASAANPVEQKFVASLSRPGGNVTGLALLLQEVGARRLQLLKEILPRAKTFARLYSSVSIVDMQPSLIRENDQAARKLDVTVEHMAVAKPEEIDAIFERAAARRVEALIVEPEAVFAPNRARMAALALKHRLPMMCADARYAEAGRSFLTARISRHDIGALPVLWTRFCAVRSPGTFPLSRHRNSSS